EGVPAKSATQPTTDAKTTLAASGTTTDDASGLAASLAAAMLVIPQQVSPEKAAAPTGGAHPGDSPVGNHGGGDGPVTDNGVAKGVTRPLTEPVGAPQDGALTTADVGGPFTAAPESQPSKPLLAVGQRSVASQGPASETAASITSPPVAPAQASQ